MAEIELGCPYQIYPPDQSTYAAFNDPANSNFAGYVTDVTGLDDAEVRENAQNVVAGDGGYNGPFWRGRRPWTLTGIVMPVTPISARSAAMRKIEWIMAQCMRQDGFFVWTPSDGIRRTLQFRKQQPVRFTTGQSNVQKNFQIAGVAADWRILSATTKTAIVVGPSWQTTTFNAGDAPASPLFTITGPINAPVITNLTTGKKFTFTTFAGSDMVPAGYTMTINLSTQYPLVSRADGYDFSGYLDPSNTDYTIGPEPGTNTWLFSGSDAVVGQTSLQIQWNDAYV